MALTNVEKLKKLKMLGEVRQRLGADTPEDENFDYQINTMSNSDLVKKYCGWYLGDDSWWTDLKKRFDQLEELDKSSTN